MGGGAVGVTSTDVTVITTSGSLSLAGNLDATGKDVFLDASGGSVSGSGVIRGNTLTVNAKDGINLGGDNEAGSVILNNATSGNIRYKSGDNVTVEADNDASGGNIDISLDTGHTLTVGANNIQATNGTITLNADAFTVTGDIDAGTGNNGRIRIYNVTADKTFGLRGGAGDISLAVDHIKAAILEIGRDAAPVAGTITVGTGAAFDTSVQTLVLRANASGAEILGGGNITVPNLAIESDASVNFDAGFGAANVAVRTNGNGGSGMIVADICLVKLSGGFNIATIEGINGLSCSSGGSISLTAIGDITQSAVSGPPAYGAGIIETTGVLRFETFSGDINLNDANKVNTLRAEGQGNLSFTNDGPLVVGQGVYGIKTVDGGVTLNAGTNNITLKYGIVSGDASNPGGNIVFSSPVVLDTNVLIGSNGTVDGNITFTGTVNGAGNLRLDAGTGNIAFQEAVGGDTPLGGTVVNHAIAVVNSAGVTFSSTLATSRGLDINAPVTFYSNVDIGIDAPATTHKNNVAINGAITVSSGQNIGFGNAAAHTTTVNGASGTATIKTDANNGNITFAGPVNVTGLDLKVESDGTGNIVFNKTLDSDHNLTITTVGAGGVEFRGDVSVGTGDASSHTALSVDAESITFLSTPVISTNANGNIKFRANGLSTTGCTVWAGGNPTPSGSVQITPWTLSQSIGYGPGITGFNANYDSSWTNVHATAFIIGDTPHTGDITIRNVTNANYVLTAINSSTGSITIEGNYSSNDKVLNLLPGTEGVILDGGGTTASIDLGTASFTVNEKFTLRDLTTGTITAKGINLGGTVDGENSETNNLILDVSAASGNTISVTGPVGGAVRLGDIEVRSINSGISPYGVVFTGAVAAKSYKQTGSGGTGGGGSTIFNSAQNYSGNFDFTGNVLTVNHDMTVGGTTEITNAGLFTKNNTGTISSTNSFTQNGTGLNSIASNVSSGANIAFSTGITIAAASLFESTGGNITIGGKIGGASNLELKVSTVAANNRKIELNASSDAVDMTGTLTVTGYNVTRNSGDLNIKAATFIVSTDTAVNPPGAMTVTGNVTNNGTISPAGKLIVTGNTINDGTITAGNSPDTAANPDTGAAMPTTYAVDFNGNYSGSGSLNNGYGNTIFFAFRGSNTAIGSGAPSSGWLVFLGNVDQTFNPNGKDLPNVLVAHADNSTGVNVSTNNAAQRGKLLVIWKGFLNLGVTGWLMDTGSSTTSPTANTFTGSSGFLLLGGVASGAEARLIAQDLTLGSAFTVENILPTFPGKACLVASGNVSIDASTTLPFTLTNLTVEWTGGTAGNLTANREIGNLTLSGSGGTLTLAAPLNTAGSINIGAGKTLDVSSSNHKITIKGNWDQGSGSTFRCYTGEVEFKGNTIFTITGNTTWYNLTCEEPGATLEFSNWNAPNDYHTIKNGGTFTVKGPSDAQRIILTRPSSVTGDPAKPPTGQEYLFWHFKLEAGAVIDFQHITLKYSWAVDRIVLPLDEAGLLDILVNYNDVPPGTNHLYDYNWIWNFGFVYAFTEDANHNGRIDRIRLQASVEMDFPPSWENGFEVEVEGYEVTRGVPKYEKVPSSVPGEEDSIWVNLVEKDHSDGNICPRVLKITNTMIKDKVRTRYLMAMVDPDGKGYIDTIDTVVPRINYTLALPEGDGVFVQISEPINDVNFSGTTDISAAGHFPVTGESGGVREFIVAANPQELSLVNLAVGKKIKIAAQDLSEGRPPVQLGVDPKYPLKPGNYFSYDVSTGSGNGLKPPYPLVAAEYAPDSAGYAAPSSAAEHRLTDLLISVPPASAADTRYFIWPLWAKNDDPTNFVGQDQFIPGTGDMNIDGSPVPERGIIWDFTGRERLQIKGSITLQMMQNGVFNDAAGRQHKLVFAQNVGNEYLAADLHGPEGLWLPDQGMNQTAPFSFLNMTPQFFPAKPAVPSDGVAVSVLPSADRSIYKFVVSGTAYSPGMFDFYFHLDGTPPHLYAARLDAAPGVIPADWYRRVKPFTFRFRDLASQRGGVTILNNVLDPTKDERTFVHYHLVNSGRVTIQVFTLDGTLVQVLQRGSQEAGEYDAIWDGKNRQGRPVARGMYFIRVVAPDIDEIRKVMVVK
jgi:hypothetical protein